MKKSIGLVVAGLLLAGCGADGPLDQDEAAGLTPVVSEATPLGKPAETVTPDRPVPTTIPPLPDATPPPSGVVPNVVGLDHQLAQDTMQAAGFYNLSEEDATGQNRMLIFDRNWVVVEQIPAGGTAAPSNSVIVLRSKKIGE